MKGGSGQADTVMHYGDVLDLKGRIRNNSFSYSVLVGLTLIFLFLSALYFINLMRWTHEPIFGWTTSSQSGPLEVIHVRKPASTAGLRIGDRFLSVNGNAVKSISEIRKFLDRKIPGENRYEVSRKGNKFTIFVQNVPKGFSKTFAVYGFTWLLGIISFILGAIVFFMKPSGRSSWAYLLATFTAALYISFAVSSKLSPGWLAGVRTFAATFSAAAIIHLANVFPVQRPWIRDKAILLTIPYFFSALLFISISINTAVYSDAPRPLIYMTESYRGLAMLYFIGSVLFTYFSTKEKDARVKAGAVLFGAVVALLFPVFDLFLTIIFRVHIITHPAYYLPFYMFFPIAIAYAIIKHNLFDVDLFVKRAAGYGLMTALVGGLYVGMVISIKPLSSAFPTSDQFSAFYPLIFALLVLFLFRPIHTRLQKVVNKVFFRERIDYMDAVTSISKELTTVLDLKQVIIKIIYVARDMMSIDTAGVIRLHPEVYECPALFIHDTPNNAEAPTNNEEYEERCLDLDDPILFLLKREKKLITRKDVAENPRYAEIRDACLKQFESFRSTIAFPLIFQNEVKAILLVGTKKSGHFYTRDDIDLLFNLSRQGAIAMENAKKAEKIKQDEAVRINLARYLSPQVVDRVMKGKMEVDLGGDRKEVTVLFSDIRDFTGIIKTRDPDKIVEVLNEYFTEMAAIIFENHGSLDKYIGDAIVTVFGSFIDLENPVENAVETSLQMLERLRILNRKWAADFEGFTMDVGIGVDTGVVFLGNVGSPDRMEFTVIGDAVNSAQLLSDVAAPGQILCTARAAKNLGEQMKLRKIPPITVQGKEDGLEVFEVVSAKQLGSGSAS